MAGMVTAAAAGAYCSRQSEEGFHSGSSQEDVLCQPPLDRLINEFGAFNIQQKR